MLALQVAADEVGIEVHQQVGGQHLVQLVPTGHVEQRQGQGAGFAEQAVISPSGLDELVELPMHPNVALPEHLDLPLDQRDGALGLVRQGQFGEQRGVGLEKVGVALEVVDDLLFDHFNELRFAHGVRLPSYTKVAAPAILTGASAPCQ